MIYWNVIIELPWKQMVLDLVVETAVEEGQLGTGHVAGGNHLKFKV